MVLWAIVISKIMVVQLYDKGCSISLGIEFGLNHKKKILIDMIVDDKLRL